MKGIKIPIIGIIGLMISALLGSCAAPTYITNYYNAKFLADGRIIATRERLEVANNGAFSGGGGDKAYDWVVLDVDTSTGRIRSEQTIEYLGYSPRYIYTDKGSPKGSYIARIIYANLVHPTVEIWDAHTLKKVKSIEIDPSTYESVTVNSSASQVDWSPDESKIVVALNTITGDRVSIWDVASDTKVRDITQIERLECWGYGPYILGHRAAPNGGGVDEVEINEDGVIVYETNIKRDGYYIGPLEYFPDGKSILSTGAGYTYSTENFDLIESYDALYEYFTSVAPGGVVYPSLNPLNPKQVVYGLGAVDFSHGERSEGIFLINLDGTGKITVR